MSEASIVAITVAVIGSGILQIIATELFRRLEYRRAENAPRERIGLLFEQSEDRNDTTGLARHRYQWQRSRTARLWSGYWARDSKPDQRPVDIDNLTTRIAALERENAIITAQIQQQQEEE